MEFYAFKALDMLSMEMQSSLHLQHMNHHCVPNIVNHMLPENHLHQTAHSTYIHHQKSITPMEEYPANESMSSTVEWIEISEAPVVSAGLLLI